MGRIPEDVIEQVLAAYDVVEVVGRYLPLKSAGALVQGPVPVPRGEDPLLHRQPGPADVQVLRVRQGREHLRLPDGARGADLPGGGARRWPVTGASPCPRSTARTREDESRVEVVRGALKAAHAFFVRCLASDEGGEARAYLTKRGYDEAAVRRFGLGYAPAGLGPARPAGGQAARHAGTSSRRRGWRCRGARAGTTTASATGSSSRSPTSRGASSPSVPGRSATRTTPST